MWPNYHGTKLVEAPLTIKKEMKNSMFRVLVLHKPSGLVI